MNNQNLSTLFKTTLLASAMATVVGCSDNKVPGAETKNITIADPAVNCDTVMVGTAAANRVRDGFYEVGESATGKLKATGCKDTVSGADIGDMASDGDFNDDGDGNETMTPVTTLIESIEASGQSPERAREIAAQALGVTDADLDKQPVESLALQRAAANVVNLVQLVSDQGGDPADALKKIAKNLADNNSGATTKTLADTMQDDELLDDVLSTVPDAKKAVVKAATKNASTVIQNATTPAQAVAVNKYVKDTLSKNITNGTVTEGNGPSITEITNASANIASEIESKVVAVSNSSGTTAAAATGTGGTTNTGTTTGGN